MGKFDPSTMTEREKYLYVKGEQCFNGWWHASKVARIYRTLFYIALIGNVVQCVASWLL